jgi:two-component system response regulator HydG
LEAEAHARILIAGGEAEARDRHARVLTEAGHEVAVVETCDEVLERIRASSFDLVLTALDIAPEDGIAVLQGVKRVRPSVFVVLHDVAAAVEPVLSAFRKGAFDFLVDPVPSEQLTELASRVVALRQAGQQRSELAVELANERLRVVELRRQLGVDDPFRGFLGSSAEIQRLVETLREVARTESTVLLTGESGTGKGLVARTIHEASARRNGPFVEANCVVYSEGILHSELFGHERGAFTGAGRTKRGRFELARGGTLFLDEIGEISPATQLLLLRVLQERTFERVGGEETLEAEVRLIAATNRDLHEALRRGTFRSDLYYRLNVIPVHIPPLRDRIEDVPLLAQHFLERCSERTERHLEGFTPGALDALMRHSWPGNVRELENLVERLVVLSRGERIDVPDLPPAFQDEPQAEGGTRPGTLKELELRRIEEALREAGGNKKLAAARLGIHRSTLYAKMQRFGLSLDHFETEPERDEPSERAAS